MPDLSDLPRKAALRAALITHRRSLPAASLESASALVLAELVSLVRREGPRCVAGYVPIGAEPGGPGLPEALAGALAPGARLLLPVLRPDLDLEWGRTTGRPRSPPAPAGCASRVAAGSARRRWPPPS
ncbi:hypothetical protein Prum_048130 [Phytohabitans rumicis]|uniref:5-formyltetrahydrofolate cyclo-ligase n=1 Tax=Phytohabitans rumicis TaxID=1076125 RepID=A0A6V8L8P3_9ACTN|nr:hypothetical protein Prum_048130 [Phytohabitans rumicis]